MGNHSGQRTAILWLTGALALVGLFWFAPTWLVPVLIGVSASAVAFEATTKLRAGQSRVVRAALIGGGVLLALASGTAWLFSPPLAVALLLILALTIIAGRRGRPSQVGRQTGLLGAAVFAERAEEELSRGLRFGRPVAVLIVSLDQAELLRRQYGRRAAEAALKRIVDILVGESRSYDLLTRLDGACFATVLPETTREEALAAAQRIGEAVALVQFAPPGEEAALPLSVSAGLALHPDEGHEIHSLLRKARQQSVSLSVGDVAAIPALPTTLPVAPPAADSRRKLPQWYQLAYIAAAWLACLLVFALTFTPIRAEQWLPLLTLGIIALASRQMRIDLYGRGSVANHFVALLAAGVYIGPTAAMILGVLCGPLINWPVERVNPRKTLFDAASFALSAGGATVCHRYFAMGLPNDGWFSISLIVQGLFIGAVCYLINVLLLTGIVSCAEGVNTLAVWKERYAWFLPYTLAFGVLAIFMVEAGRVLGPIGMIIFAVPTFMMRLVTKQYVDRTKDHVLALREAHNRLEKANNELQDSVNALEQSYAATLNAFSGMLDARDSETEGHSQRVVAYATSIGRAMKLSSQDLAALEVGALLHDIGKVGVSDAILRKNGPLTPDEWGEMKKHPEIGYQLTSGIPFLHAASPVVRHHHERWDGKGYPDGLSGEAIPLVARIFSVADSFDAMISDRPYRRGMAYEQAIAELQRVAGVQFDPQVIEAFLALTATPGWLETVRQTAIQPEIAPPPQSLLTHA
jgi:diguanylate cyclase (GGDEF)-like protein